MKIPRLLLAAALFLPVRHSFAQEVEYPSITFEKTTHNFGLFDREHPIQTCWFKFKNTGKSELVILSAEGTCSCTKAEASEKPVLPGQTDSIKVTFNGTGLRPGVIRKTVIVTSNTKEKTAYIYITGELVEQLVEERLQKSADGSKDSKEQ